MSRIVSVWLPRWPILRTLAAQDKTTSRSQQPIAPDRPFVLAVAGPGGPRIAALNEAAEAAGLAIGEPLADARAKAGLLQVRPVDPEADDAALRRLALWTTRYTPTASPWGETDGADGFFLDVAGSAHLFGGEEKLLADLAERLDKFGLPARLAVADTVGAAWALAHFHPARLSVLPAGEQAAALSALPIESLRLNPETRATLRRLGFKTVGALLDKPRAPFAARFPVELLRRLDQALGHIDEPLVPIVAPPVYHTLQYLLEPIFTQDAIVARVSRLMRTLTRVLVRDDVGARGLRLSLYRIDGAVETIDIALTMPTRSADHVARLIALKLEALAVSFRETFRGSGFDLHPLEDGELLLSGPPIAAPMKTTEPARLVLTAVAESLPSGEGSSSLRRLGAEIEMWLHDHSVNFGRAQRGAAAVAALWLWGGGLGLDSPAAAAKEITAAVFGSDAYVHGLLRLAGGEVRPIPVDWTAVLGESRAQRALGVVEVAELLHANASWGLSDALAEIDRRLISPSLAALRRGELERLLLVANDQCMRLRAADRWRLWRRMRPVRPGVEALT